MDCVYLVLEETSIDGSWSDPEDAVRYYFRDSIDDRGLLDYDGESLTVKEMAERMLGPRSDYPVLVRMPINPKDENVQSLDR